MTPFQRKPIWRRHEQQNLQKLNLRALHTTQKHFSKSEWRQWTEKLQQHCLEILNSHSSGSQPMAPGKTDCGHFSPQLSPGTFTSCPGSPLLPKVLSPDRSGLWWVRKGSKDSWEILQFKGKATQWDFLIPGAFSKARVTYPHHVFQTCILTCLHSCPKVQQCSVPMQIISLPPKTSYHLCFPPAHSLSQ